MHPWNKQSCQLYQKDRKVRIVDEIVWRWICCHFTTEWMWKWSCHLTLLEEFYTIGPFLAFTLYFRYSEETIASKRPRQSFFQVLQLKINMMVRFYKYNLWGKKKKKRNQPSIYPFNSIFIPSKCSPHILLYSSFKTKQNCLIKLNNITQHRDYLLLSKKNVIKRILQLHQFYWRKELLNLHWDSLQTAFFPCEILAV